MSTIRAGSRPLPIKPNLQHLKKEAKARLRAMPAAAPDATLARAQGIVAREYGFSSWRALKAWVDSVEDAAERIIQAVRIGNLPAVRATLDQFPPLVNCTTDRHDRIAPSDTRAMRLIHLAVSENQLDVGRLLIERGADLNVRNADGRLPLHDCFELGRDDFWDLLLASGAEADVAAAAGGGILDRLRAILERDPHAANDLTTGESPLGWCAYGDQPEAARLLLAHGAIVTRPPYDWYTWRAAAMVSATRVARVIIDQGADPNCEGSEGDTPLHAVLRSRIVLDPSPFVDLLLEHGANPAHRNHAGQTPLDIALEEANHFAETYFPVRRLGAKRLNTVISRLRPR